MYAQVGEFRISWIISTVPLTWFLCTNRFFFQKTKCLQCVVSLFWTKFCHFLMCTVAEVVHRSSFSFPAFCVRWLKTASLFRKIWPLKKRPLHAAECYIEYTKFISNKGKGPSIKDVSSNFSFLTPPTYPCPLFLLNRLI